MSEYSPLKLLLHVTVIGLLILAGEVLYQGIRLIDFCKRCEAACAPDTSMTPMINGRSCCLCDEGNGVMRRVFILED